MIHCWTSLYHALALSMYLLRELENKAWGSAGGSSRLTTFVERVKRMDNLLGVLRISGVR